jgi:hypothetical protein
VKAQHQTIHGIPNGNCFSTCIAALLDMDTEDVPNFCSMNEDGKWFDKADEWCQTQGYRLVQVHGVQAWGICVGTLFIASGPSPRYDCDHSVIATVAGDGEALSYPMVMDPHPSGDGLKGPFTNVCFLVKK